MKSPQHTSTRQFEKLVAPALVIAVAALASACGKGTGSVTLSSPAFNAPASGRVSLSSAREAELTDDRNVSGAAASAPSVTDFSFCLRDISLHLEDDSAVRKEGEDDDSIKVSFGLVSFKDGKSSVTWGTTDVPVGTEIRKIKAKIHKDKQLCGVDYSVKINDLTLTRDIELQFKFPAGKTLESGETISLDIGTIIAKLEAAYLAGQFHDSGSIDDYLKGVEGHASGN